MEINLDCSLLAQFDEFSRIGFHIQDCDYEFGEFSQGQEECRRKWLDLEKQIQVMKHKISEANKHQSKLELSNHHVEMLLKDEVKMRRSLQEDISQYHNQFDLVRDCFSRETDIKEEIMEKLNCLGTRNTHLMNNTIPRQIGRLETIDEVNSAELDSVMASSHRSSGMSDSDPTEEELELSGTVRSYRDRRFKRPISDLVPREVNTPEVPSTKRINCASTTSEVGILDQCIVSTTKVSFSLQTGTTVANVIESFPASSSDEFNHNEVMIKNHLLKQRTIIHHIETCNPCGHRIKFGKSALKCMDCGLSCHIDCKTFLPKFCDPKPTELTTASSKKKPSRFFSSPSIKK